MIRTFQYTTVLLLLVCVEDATAQTTAQVKRPLIAEGYLAYGVFTQRDPELTQDEWRAMLPGSQLLAGELPMGSDRYWGGGYGPYGGYGYALGSATGMASVGLGLDLDRSGSEGAHFEHRLRLGATYGGPQYLYGSWSRSLTGPFDTLVSTQTGQEYYRDTTWTERYSAHATRSRVGLDASFVLRRVSASRWSWYVGAGVSFGTSLNGTAVVSHTVSRTGNSYSNNGYYGEEVGRETFRPRPSQWAAAQVLFGVDLRLGRTSPFWSGLHLYAESRPTLSIDAMPGLTARTSGAFQQLLGLRIDLR